MNKNLFKQKSTIVFMSIIVVLTAALIASFATHSDKKTNSPSNSESEAESYYQAHNPLGIPKREEKEIKGLSENEVIALDIYHRANVPFPVMSQTLDAKEYPDTIKELTGIEDVSLVKYLSLIRGVWKGSPQNPFESVEPFCFMIVEFDSDMTCEYGATQIKKNLPTDMFAPKYKTDNTSIVQTGNRLGICVMTNQLAKEGISATDITDNFARYMSIYDGRYSHLKVKEDSSQPAATKK